jgi:hypothetical protein
MRQMGQTISDISHASGGVWYLKIDSVKVLMNIKQRLWEL